MTRITGIKYSIVTGLSLAFLSVGMWVIDEPIVTSVGIILSLGTSSGLLAHLWPSHLRGTRFILGSIIALSFVMIAGSFVYYVANVTPAYIYWIWMILPFVSWLISRLLEQSQFVEESEGEASFFISGAAALLALSLLVYGGLLAEFNTTEPSRSPWLIMTPLVILAIVSAGFWLLQIARAGKTRLAIFGSIATLFGVLSIAWAVFPLGYGFDPFLHQATLNHIAEFGTITPKPFYYIGQYAIELALMLPTAISSHTIDIVLLPTLTALILPTVAAASIWQITKRGIPTAVAALATLLLPLSPFINTTPQGLAYLWSLITLFLALPELVSRVSWTSHLVLGIVSIATLSIHPLAGLPALLFFLLVVLSRNTVKQGLVIPLKVGFWITVLAGAIMLPTAFIIFGNSSIEIQNISIDTLLPSIFLQTHYNAIGDFVALVTANGWIWLITFVFIAAFILKDMKSKRWLIYPLLAGVMIANALVLALVGDFSFLIDYEQTNYVDRVVFMTLLVLLPLAVLGLSLALERLWTIKRISVTFGTALLLALAIGANVYATYPRHDAYNVSRGFTVGVSDHNTVSSIASHAGDTPYVVLANQSVSAAAVQDNGFLHYYGEGDDVFYYPIPTGGPLYEIFLEMIENNPTDELAEKAMDLSGVDRVYFVVNKYWWSAEVAIERARATTDDYFIVDDGATWVFVFTRASS
jgi:hypothetical protein